MSIRGISVRQALVVAVAAVMVVVPASTALAHGGPAESFTVVMKDVAMVFPDANPCTGAPGTVSSTESGVFHITVHPDGHLHLTGTFTAPFVFTPDDSSEPTYTGRYTVWFGENHNSGMANATFTFSVRAVGSDGSRLVFTTVSHITAATIDFSTDPPTLTDVKVAFDKATCH